jgi:hypothetical protein
VKKKVELNFLELNSIKLYQINTFHKSSVVLINASLREFGNQIKFKKSIFPVIVFKS